MEHAKRLKLLGLVGLCSAMVLLVATVYVARRSGRSHSSLQRGQCTWYAFERAADAGWHIRFDTNWGRHARSWWEKVTNADRGSDPRVGSIMVLDGWPGNEYGHVAYVEQVLDRDHWTVSHANMATSEIHGERDGVTIYRARIERAPGGVVFVGSRRVLALRGFLYPPQTRA